MVHATCSDRKFQTKKFIGIKLAINFARSFLTLFRMSKLHEWLSIIRSTYVNIQYLPVVFINYTVVQTEVRWNFKSNFWSLYINFLSVIKILKLSITTLNSQQLLKQFFLRWCWLLPSCNSLSRLIIMYSEYYYPS